VLDEVARIKVRPSTFEGYKAKLKVSVRNGIGRKRLCDLQGYEIQKLYNETAQRGLSAVTIRHVHRILSPAFKQAVKWKLLSQNPCDLCELPRVAKKEMRCFSCGETTSFLNHAKEDRYYAAFVLAIETGMRPEEYLALKWKDIDFENGRPSINRALAIQKVVALHSTNRRLRVVEEAFRSRLQRCES